jgi:uncharacterized protein YegP (UPF0339 family)
MYFEIYPHTVGLSRQWGWRLKAANHKTIAAGESYFNKADCIHAVNLLKGTTVVTPVYDVAS